MESLQQAAARLLAENSNSRFLRRKQPFSFQRGIFPRWLVIKLTWSLTQTVDFLRRTGLIKNSNICKSSGTNMESVEVDDTTDGFMWICREIHNGRKCEIKVSIRDDSWFSGSSLPLELILIMTHYIVEGARKEVLFYDYGLEIQTVTDWAETIRETLVDDLYNNSQQIGGKGTVVEIYEFKYGPRKHNWGHFVEGQWVLGGVERQIGRLFLIPLEDRTKVALINLLSHWVLPDTTIYTDCWQPYDRLGVAGFNRHSLNHDIHFVMPGTEGHIEETCRHKKLLVPHYRRDKGRYEEYLGHYMLKKLAKTEKLSIFLKFLDIVKNINWSTNRGSECSA